MQVFINHSKKVLIYWANLFFVVSIVTMITEIAGLGSLFGPPSRMLAVSLLTSLLYHFLLPLVAVNPAQFTVGIKGPVGYIAGLLIRYFLAISALNFFAMRLFGFAVMDNSPVKLLIFSLIIAVGLYFAHKAGAES